MAEITVYYTSGSSDKEYRLQMTGSSGRLDWSVAFQYGRRGNANAGGYKIQCASEDKARKVFEKYLKEKIGKGYTVQGSGEPGTTPYEEAILRAYGHGEERTLSQAYQGDRVMQDAEERLGVRFQQTGRHPTPEESSLHTGNRDKDLGPAPQPPEPEPKITVIGTRRVTWVGRRPQTQEPVVSSTAREVLALTAENPPAPSGELGRPLHSQQPTPIDTDEEVERLLDDDEWGMQDKYDGKKVTVRVKDGVGQAFNKKGEPIVIPQQVMVDVIACGRDIEVDGELIGLEYHVYDCLSFYGSDQRRNGYQVRHARIPRFHSVPSGFGGSVEISPLYVGREYKRVRFEEIRRANGEGVVFKRLGAKFTAGKSHGDMRKHKFYATASCIVTEGRPGKRSVGIVLYDEDLNLIPVGNVTIGGKKPIPSVNSIIEVKYLYAYPNGSLYQPSYKGIRDDVDKEECLISQLKYKQGTEA